MAVDPLAPPRPELFALLEAVKDHPDDDTPRLVLADWLDEQDNELDAERAKFIRDEITRYRETPRRDRNREENAAMKPLASRWLGPVMQLVAQPHLVMFVRGLPIVTIGGPTLIRPAVRHLFATEAFAFVQFVDLMDAGGARMAIMAAMEEFRHIPGLRVNPFNALGTTYSAKFLGSPNVSGLRQIEFRSVNPGAVGVQALATNPALARLRRLSLRHNKIVDKAVAALGASAHLTNLRYLSLADNNIGDKGAEALAASRTLASLEELDLRQNHRLTDHGKQLLREKFGNRVKLD